MEAMLRAESGFASELIPLNQGRATKPSEKVTIAPPQP